MPKLKNSASLGDVAGTQRGAGQLDHRADRDSRCVAPCSSNTGFGGAVDQRADDRQFAPAWRPAGPSPRGSAPRRSPRHLERGLEDGAGLHLVDFGIGDAEPAAAMAEHRVEFVQARRRGACSASTATPAASATSANSSSPCGRNSCSGGSSRRMVTGSPAMIRKISAKSPRWAGSSLSSARAAAGLVLGEDHLADVGDPLGVEEHMLGAAQADPLGAELARGAAIERRLGIGADPEAALACRPSPSACRNRRPARAGRSAPRRASPRRSSRRW